MPQCLSDSWLLHNGPKMMHKIDSYKSLQVTTYALIKISAGGPTSLKLETKKIKRKLVYHVINLSLISKH